MASLNAIMSTEYGRMYSFIVQGNTRWYSHYGLVVSLFRVKRARAIYKASVDEETDLLRKDRAADAMAAIGNAAFWKELELIAELLRPLTIEIGIIK